MELILSPETPKPEVFLSIQHYLGELAVSIESIDTARPWGGFFVIEKSSTDIFVDTFYGGYDIDKIKQFGNELQPKILVVGPNEILSWQYHNRRAEIWSSVFGPVGYHRSMDDNQGTTHTLSLGEVAQFNPLERHRLRGLDNWGVVAEFWQHTDPTDPSDEDDIVRLDDAYGRTS